MKVLLLLAATTAIAHADPSDELTIGTEARGLRSNSADALTDSGYTGGRLSFARRLDIPVMPGLQLWAAAGFAWGGTNGTMFQTLTTAVGTVGFTLGGRARYVFNPHVAVSGRLDLGQQHVSLELTDQNDHTASDTGWGTFAQAAIALDLVATDGQNHLGFGLRAELGYVAARGVALAPKSPHDDTELSIMTTGASIGHLDLGGPSFTLSALTQF